jgi:hypothetical protein
VTLCSLVERCRCFGGMCCCPLLRVSRFPCNSPTFICHLIETVLHFSTHSPTLVPYLTVDLLFPNSTHSYALKMERSYPSETSVQIYQTTRCTVQKRMFIVIPMRISTSWLPFLLSSLPFFVFFFFVFSPLFSLFPSCCLFGLKHVSHSSLYLRLVFFNIIMYAREILCET